MKSHPLFSFINIGQRGRNINKCRALVVKVYLSKASVSIPSPRSGRAEAITESLLIFAQKALIATRIYSVLPCTVPDPSITFHCNPLITC